MGKVLSFGEFLLRICPDSEGDWLNNNQLPFFVGGAELNVATALALWDVPSAYFSALPDNFLAEQLKEFVSNQGIDTSPIQTIGSRIGLYFLHKGKDLKNAGVIYDRANSSFTELRTNTINWDEVFENVSWFHFSAICPAISQQVADVCEEALSIASQKGICISIDLNYRSKLWQYGKKASEVVPSLVKYCDLVMGNVWASQTMLNIPVMSNLAEEDIKSLYLKQAQITSEEILKQYPKSKSVANTFRFDYGKGVRYYTTLYTAGKLHVSQEYLAEEIVDKVGSGDCFMAGLIYGFYHKLEPDAILEFATAAAFSKLFIPSDATTIKPDEIRSVVEAYKVG
ncbi:MAG: carbohydrate kinase [Sphingobacteriales bacterium]|nr:carbohydrate kinase [Sphingobacteriales bacterium]